MYILHCILDWLTRAITKQCYNRTAHDPPTGVGAIKLTPTLLDNYSAVHTSIDVGTSQYTTGSPTGF